jgi:hypothetical protein
MRFSLSPFLAPAALLLATAPAALFAQEVVQALPGTTDADRLAEQMRALASNPRDLNALIAAADLSLSLGDLSGAASLYARAEKVAIRASRRARAPFWSAPSAPARHCAISRRPRPPAPTCAASPAIADLPTT